MTSDKIQIYNNQDYQKIRDECLKGPKRLWEDTSYEATYEARSDWEWRRPGDIVTNPSFVKAGSKEEPSRFDLNNLNLGESKNKDVIKHNIAVLSAITLNSSVFKFVVPGDNVEFSDKSYLGLFHFRFWRNGKFYDVVVDDRLPTRDGKLVSFLKNGQPVEFWPFILEKAYTKLFGSAESLGKIIAPEFIVDLIGGVSETLISLGHTKPLLGGIENMLHKASEKESFAIFSRHWHSDVKNMDMKNVYCITKTVYVDINKSNADKSDTGKSDTGKSDTGKSDTDKSDTDKTERILLLRIFMPFITETKEWKGPWSEGSDEWKSVPEAKKQEIGVAQKYEFWMPLSEFNKHDWDIYVVHLNPQYIDNLGGKQTQNLAWYSTSADGKWVRGVSSGGSRREYLGSTFYLNPQYSISLKSPDAGFSDCTIIVSVLQKTRRSSRVPMNVYFFELKQKAEERLDWDFFKHNNPLVDSFPHDDARELTRRIQIPPGEYCIVVAPNNPHHEAHFFLRILAEQSVKVGILNEKVSQKEVDVRVSLAVPLSDQESVLASDKHVQDFFEEVSGEDKVVGWKGLKKVLDFAMDYEKPKSDNYTVRNSLLSYVFPSNSVFDTMESKEFSKDLSRSLLATADLDHSGKLTLHEFQGLWAQIRQWIQIYEMNSDETGYLPKENLREALDSAGFQLNSDILCSLAIRYSNRDNVIPFDDFLMCTSKLRTVFDYYRFKDPEYTDQAVFTLDEWLRKSIYS